MQHVLVASCKTKKFIQMKPTQANLAKSFGCGGGGETHCLMLSIHDAFMICCRWWDSLKNWRLYSAMVGKVLLLMAVVATVLKFITPKPTQIQVNEEGMVASSGDLYRELFSCQFTLSKRPDIYKVELIAFNLLLPQQRGRVSNSTIIEQNPANKFGAAFERLDLSTTSSSSGGTNNLHLSTLDPSLPFIFFINGFNHEGAINGSWLEGAANMVAHHANLILDNKYSGSNFIFLSWRVTGLITYDPMSIPLAYYRTMANYDVIMDEIALVLAKIVDYIEETQGGGSWHSMSADGGCGGDFRENRANYYAKFNFYAHSLGSHLMSNAIDLVHQSRPWVKFGKLVGLDPALPCFLDDNHGLSADRLGGAVAQVLVIHTNAVFSGIYSERGNIEIVLNGGTFQPGCHWFDFGCSHSRANNILTYMDNQCQMVAYWCSKYEQFKYGACETCEPRHNKSGSMQHQYLNCVLVNLPEQHVDTGEISLINSGGNIQLRQLAYADDEEEEEDIEADQNSTKSNGETESTKELPKLTKRFGFHFVNTDPNFASSQTHCLQHYQLRLLTLLDNVQGQIKCPLSSYFLHNNNQIQVKLFHESEGLKGKSFRHQHKGRQLSITTARDSSRIDINKKLTPIVQDKLHTGLVTFSGKPELFVGAVIDTIDLEKWSTCMIKERVAGEIKFTLDIAFMSHTRSRHAYSSILCGRWNPYDHPTGEMTLGLCKPTDLTNVSSEIDEILDQIKFHHQYDSWQVSLLDSLFYLYSKWEPLR